MGEGDLRERQVSQGWRQPRERVKWNTGRNNCFPARTEDISTPGRRLRPKQVKGSFRIPTIREIPHTPIPATFGLSFNPAGKDFLKFKPEG